MNLECKVFIAIFTMLLAITANAARYEQAIHNIKTENYELAYKQLVELSKLGNKDAQYIIGSLYLNGQGVKTNHLKAYAWYKLASSKGDVDANKAANEIYTLMTPAQQKRGDQEVANLEKTMGDAAIAKAIFPVLVNDNLKSNHVSARPVRGKPPQYPMNALQAGLTGTAVVDFTVGKDGRAKFVSIVNYSHSYFIEPSLEAAKTLIFEPVSISGVLVETSGVKNRFIFELSGVGFDAEAAYKEIVKLKQNAINGSSVDRLIYARALPVLADYVDEKQKSSLDNPMHWLQLAAADGLPQAKYTLGLSTYYGESCEADPIKSNFWLESAANDDYPLAKVQLGRNKVVSSDVAIQQEGLKLLKDASDSGDIVGQLEYALTLILPPKGLKADIPLATSIVESIKDKNTEDLISLYEARYLAYAKANNEKKAKKAKKKLKRLVKQSELPWDIFEANLQRILDGKEVLPLIKE